ncbi:MAG: hypothetical protein Tp1109DCM542121_19 [Prokaryotic dsDNA virus sp.]|nr:MAG: hypothetical protein Tp1109DCM542121_19 [Prokaryotic dsDNA virus sp.]|tara:strand:+ start:13928 stop:14131 length:204 start_codon:yes stop_codon:yes gene_type:complete
MSFVSIKFEDEGVGYGMSELKDYELPLQFRQVSPWAGRWNEYFQQARRKAEQNVKTVEQAVNEEEQR